MLESILENNFENKMVLDMGCGTGILAIMASKSGASQIVAIDYDPICFESTIENATLNDITNIVARCGSKEVIPEKQFDIILANINRNILLDQMKRYAEVLAAKGELYISGFYESPDLEILIAEAEVNDLKYISHKVNKEWVCAKFIK